MPSRKRNKGKERKAKKAELEVKRIENEKMVVREGWQGWARGQDMLEDGRVITQCNHGCDLVIPNSNNHPVTSFMDAFFMYDANDSNILSIPMEKYLRETYRYWEYK